MEPIDRESSGVLNPRVGSSLAQPGDILAIDTRGPLNGSSLLTQPAPWIVGHRGAAEDATENTLESLELAVTQGADMVELDVQLTADGQLVAFHDATLERLAGSEESVEGSVRERLQSRFSSLASLPEILRALPSSTPLNIELKCREADPERLVARLALDLDRRQRVLISSFDHELLAMVRCLLPGRSLAPLGKHSADELLAAADELNAWSVHCHRRLAAEVLAGESAGRPVLAYTVNEAAQARGLLELGVSGLFTDAPGRLRAELAG
jgi:glycerophosphoryl diester phosphodiesterase